MEEKREYDCGKCTNRNTPICDACNYANSPSGKISRPTMFTESVNISAHMNAALLEAKNRIIPYYNKCGDKRRVYTDRRGIAI